MAAPFHNAIKGTTAGTPGTGAFTPNAASVGHRPWSHIESGWIGLVRYEDGSDWELTWSYWNGTTLTRASTQREQSSTGSILSLTSSATAAMIVNAADVQSHLGTASIAWAKAVPTTSGFSVVGLAMTNIGTGGGVALTSTNYMTEQPRATYTSATTAGAEAGARTTSVCCVSSSAAGRGAWEVTKRWGVSQLPTNPRLFCGVVDAAVNSLGNTEPGTGLAQEFAAFAKDSGDANIQFMVNGSNTAGATKQNTGIALVVDGWYQSRVWSEPGSLNVDGLLIRMDTGAIWRGTATSNTPPDSIGMRLVCEASLSGTTGTAAIMHVGQAVIKTGR